MHRPSSSSSVSPVTIYSQSSTIPDIGYGSMRSSTSSTSSIIDHCQCTTYSASSSIKRPNQRSFATIEASIDSFYRNVPTAATSINDKCTCCHQQNKYYENVDSIDELEKADHRSTDDVHHGSIDLDRVHPSIELQRRIDIESMAVNIIRMIDELRSNTIDSDEHDYHIYEQIADDTDDIRMMIGRTPPPPPNTRRRGHHFAHILVDRLRTFVRSARGKKQMNSI